jgi:hypothetical protein
VNFMKSLADGTAEAAYTRAAASHRRGFNALSLPSDEVDGQVESGRTTRPMAECVHAVEFSKTGAVRARAIPSVSNRCTSTQKGLLATGNG